MSLTFSLVCHETKQKIWVGQGRDQARMSNFYAAQPEVIARLGRFLEATRGKPLVLLCDDEEGQQFSEYEEFEDPEPSD